MAERSTQSTTESGKRPYHSPTRQRHAEETRRHIIDAARTLFRRSGYAGTTIEDVAKAAGISPKTVTAVFGSKRDLLSALVEQAEFGPQFQETRDILHGEPTVQQRLELAARLTRQAYEALTPEFDLLRGASAVATEIADVARNVGERRRQREAHLIHDLADHHLLRNGLTPDDALDEMWALTSFDVYRALVIERGWSPDRYESWLIGLLVQRLLEPR